MSHGIVKCELCDRIIRQCRCRNHTKNVSYELCQVCQDRQKAIEEMDREEKTYYFIAYQWKRTAGKWNPEIAMTEKHPLQWQKDATETGNREDETYKIVSWQTISKEMYEKYVGEI